MMKKIVKRIGVWLVGINRAVIGTCAGLFLLQRGSAHGFLLRKNAGKNALCKILIGSIAARKMAIKYENNFKIFEN